MELNVFSLVTVRGQSPVRLLTYTEVGPQGQVDQRWTSPCSSGREEGEEGEEGDVTPLCADLHTPFTHSEAKYSRAIRKVTPVV